MELQKIIVLCIGLVVLGGALWYLTSTNDAEVQTSDATTESVGAQTATEETSDEELTGFGSLTDLLGLGRDITCTYTYEDENGSGSGTGYFSQGAMRLDSTYTQEGNTFDTHVINDGENLYSWTLSNEGSFAFVTPVDTFEEGETPEAVPVNDNPGVDTMNENVSYECDSWNADVNMFVPPSDIEFVDMSAMFEGMMQNMPEEMRTNMGTFGNQE